MDASTTTITWKTCSSKPTTKLTIGVATNLTSYSSLPSPALPSFLGFNKSLNLFALYLPSAVHVESNGGVADQDKGRKQTLYTQQKQEESK
jgi:hypothetical protein